MGLEDYERTILQHPIARKQIHAPLAPQCIVHRFSTGKYLTCFSGENILALTKSSPPPLKNQMVSPLNRRLGKINWFVVLF